MTDKELRRLNRRQLLELLVEQAKETEQLQTELAQLKARLEEREIRIQESGSIAEAALRLNGVFEAAQAAADQYLSNIRNTCRKEEAPDAAD